MPKIKACIRIENETKKDVFETNGIIQENKLKYKDNDSTMMIYDYEKQILFRENNELKITYPFSLKEKTIGIIELKDLNQLLNVEIETKKINRKKNDIEIEYRMENQIFRYQVEEIK